MASRRLVSSFGLAVLMSFIHFAASLAETIDLEASSAAPPDRVEWSEFTGDLGQRFQIELRTDVYGRRTRILHPLAGANATATAPESAPVFEAEPPPRAGWRSIGPDGGDVQTLAVSPLDRALMLAGLASVLGGRPRSGIYRSIDGGRNWQPVEFAGSAPGSIDRVNRIEFGSDGTAYAATSNGLFRSEDGGATWRIVPSFIADFSIVAIEGSNPAQIWVGLPRGGGIYRTRNGGLSWLRAGPAGLMPGLDCRGIAFDPARPGVVAACFGDYVDGQVFFSTNSGASWTLRNVGLPSTMFNDIVFDGSRWLLAGGDWIYLEDIMGVYASTNDGGSWTNISVPWSGRVSKAARDIEIDPSRPGTIWVAHPFGVMMTADSGAHWTFSVGGARQNALCVKNVPGGAVYFGSECFAVQRREGAGNFTPSSAGMRELNVTAIVENPVDRNEQAASFEGQNLGGVYRSRDAGRSWQIESALRARIPLVQYGADGTLYAISDGPGDLNRVGIHRRNSSTFWAALGPNEGSPYSNRLQWFEVSPHDPRLILAGGLDYSNGGFASAIWRSTNSGNSWTKPYRAEIGNYHGSTAVLLDDGTDQVALAALDNPDGPVLLRSEDRGASWSRVSNSLQFPRLSYASLAGSPALPSEVFASPRYGGPLFRSTDLGRTWRATSGPGGLESLVPHPEDAGVWFGISNVYPRRGPVRSRDSGAHFEAFDAVLSPAAYPMRLSLTSGPCPQLLLATTAGAFARSADSRAPRLTIETDPAELWPPNHRMVDVHARVEASDDCSASATFALAAVSVSESAAADDVQGAETGASDTDFQLRATRPGRSSGRVYSIRYTAIDDNGNRSEAVREVRVPHDRSEAQPAVDRAEGAREGDALATRLEEVAPSPFRVRASIGFTLAAPAPVRLEVFDLRGAVVATLLDGFRPAGRHRLEWDGRGAEGGALAGGVYWLRFSTPDHREFRKVVRLR